jgi:archaellum component FlaC
LRAELQNVDQRVAKIENTLQQLANVVVLTARQDEKLNAIERRVDRLERTSAVKHQ